MDTTRLTPGMNTAREAMTADAFQQSAFAMGRRKTAIRETLQSITSEQILGVLERLAAGAHPSPEDLQLVRMWIVGDAESYLRQENNFQDWVAEFDRLKGVIERYEGRECSEAELLELKGILEDALRVAHDIANYLEKRERVQQFEATVEASHAWDRTAREALLRILRGKLESPNL
jgi:hypothetical protein